MVEILCLLLEDPHPVKVLSMPFDKLMLTYVVVTAVAATAAVITLFMIRGQLNALREQLQQMKAGSQQTDKLIKTAQDQANALGIAAEAARKSAEAALVNAQALINSERPWLFVRFALALNNTGRPGLTQVLPTNFIFDLHNMGRTPAELLYLDARFSIRPAREVDDFKMDDANIGADFVHRRILEPGATVPAFYRFDSGSASFENASFHAVVTAQMRLMFFGIARYRDTLGGVEISVRETRFCYYYDTVTRTLIMAGLPGANRHT
ncbi:MAG: hypothetical protein ACRD72_13550 [Candidatus Angelobacter sp.]